MPLALASAPCSAAGVARPFTAARLPPRPLSTSCLRPLGRCTPSQPVQQAEDVQPCERRQVQCQAMDPRGGPKSAAGGFQFNAAYVAIVGAYAALFLLKNPYIFAALSILTIIPQNSAITSLNSLVILFYESGLFMNFAEAVYCVRLMTWLSIGCTLLSFAIFY